MITGGGQEHGLRSGTHNVPGIVGLAEAARLLRDPRADMAHYAALARRFLDGLAARLPDAPLNGARDETARRARAPYIVNVCFRGAPTEALQPRSRKRGVMVSAGSACHAKDAALARALRDGHSRGGVPALLVRPPDDGGRVGHRTRRACRRAAAPARRVREGVVSHVAIAPRLAPYDAIVVRYSEIFLKGENRRLFEDVLARNVQRALARTA